MRLNGIDSSKAVGLHELQNAMAYLVSVSEADVTEGVVCGEGWGCVDPRLVPQQVEEDVHLLLGDVGEERQQLLSRHIVLQLLQVLG